MSLAMIAEASLSFLGLGVQAPRGQLGLDVEARVRCTRACSAGDPIAWYRDHGSRAGV